MTHRIRILWGAVLLGVACAAWGFLPDEPKPVPKAVPKAAEGGSQGGAESRAEAAGTGGGGRSTACETRCRSAPRRSVQGLRGLPGNGRHPRG